ncbi:MAG: hypothetical protein PWQ15_1446 [Methanobacterium sp.]|jgi:hypothetical protein|uniref:hypothetical protein n=2 Tax=Methanobacterium TaxID=2160 RepID=UPI0024ABFA7B|nr:hypothetical protein [uncultured Methanobacterium sp.]MDI3550343.1 hypothetical protein [Methanobacterium sp.]
MITMLEGYLELKGKKIPRTLLGTSPFIGAPHFGHRARLYLLDLYRNPQEMAKVMIKSYEMGIRGIQLIPDPPVIEALEIARKEGFPLDIIATIRPESESEDMALLSELNAPAMLIDPALTDQRDWDVLGEKLDLIRDLGALPGLVTQFPFKTTQELLESPILNDFEIYMTPLNQLGYLMDSDTFQREVQSEFGEMIHKLDKTIIAMQVLAAGILTPSKAFDYLKTVDYVDMVALGVASEKEAEETFSNLFEH